jgi:hypothetical protein
MAAVGAGPTSVLGDDGGPIARPGVFAIPRLFLSSPDYGISLDIKVGIPPLSDNTAKTARIFYLSPLDVGDQSIIIDQSTAKLSAQFVVDVPIDRTVKTNVLYTPAGSEGTRRDYSLGGWMYAQPLPTSDNPVQQESSTFVRVPLFDRDTSPPDKDFDGVGLTVTGPVDRIYTVKVQIKNPKPQFGRTQYCQVFMYNYFNDATYRTMGVYRLHGAPGDPNGQSVTYKLEPDGGGHNVIFYFGYLNGQRSYPFAKAVNTFLSATQVGGFP